MQPSKLIGALETAINKKISRNEAVRCLKLTPMRWGRSTMDLMQTIHELEAWNISLIAQTGIQFDISTAQGKLLASLMASLAEFERDLLRERVRSGLSAAKARGKKLGRQPGERPKSDKLIPMVLQLLKEGESHRKIAAELSSSKNTVMGIVQRNCSICP
jgi:putative DNA-invertase from lambdoid prophage Rac